MTFRPEQQGREAAGSQGAEANAAAEAGAGHNGGPPLDDGPPWRGGDPFVYFAWKRAHEAAWSASREVMLLRLKRAERLGLTYEEYTAELLDRGTRLQPQDVERIAEIKRSRRGPQPAADTSPPRRKVLPPSTPSRRTVRSY